MALLTVCVCSICLQGTGKGSQGDAMYDVVSLQKHTECAAGARGRLQSPTEEEEPEEGTSPSSLSECFSVFYVCCHFEFFFKVNCFKGTSQNLQYNQLTRSSSERSVLIIYEFKEVLISRVREIPFFKVQYYSEHITRSKSLH